VECLLGLGTGLGRRFAYAANATPELGDLHPPGLGNGNGVTDDSGSDTHAHGKWYWRDKMPGHHSYYHHHEVTTTTTTSRMRMKMSKTTLKNSIRMSCRPSLRVRRSSSLLCVGPGRQTRLRKRRTEEECGDEIRNGGVLEGR
jgi:hypothetical protein